MGKYIIEIGDKDKETALLYLKDSAGCLRDFCQESKHYSDSDKKELESLECIIKVLENGIPYEPKDEWIPVSERLPEKRGVYIVTEKVFSLDDREHKGRYNTMVEQVEYCNGKWQRASFFEVIAWRPLPEPYQKGGAE